MQVVSASTLARTARAMTVHEQTVADAARELLRINLPRVTVEAMIDAVDGVRLLRQSGLTRGSLSAAAKAADRPTEVLRAAHTFVPEFGILGPEDVARGKMLIGRALDGLDPVVLANRVPSRSTAAADGFLPTMPGSGATNVAGRARRIARIGWERLLGKHGSDALAGRTVYASMQFTPKGTSMAQWGAQRGRFGAASFGNVSLELGGDAIAKRATIAARDSGMTLNPPRVASIERIDDVVLERLVRTHALTPDIMIRPGARLGVLGEEADPVRLRAQIGMLLHELPEQQAVDKLREYLTSPVLADVDHMIELQVRGVQANEILARHLEPMHGF